MSRSFSSNPSPSGSPASRILGVIAIVVFAVPMIGYSASPQGTTKKTKPSPSANLVKRGETLFAKNCASCHGPKGSGGEGPKLNHLLLADAKITSAIKTGFKGDMPAFGTRLSAPDIKALLAYIRSIGAAGR